MSLAWCFFYRYFLHPWWGARTSATAAQPSLPSSHSQIQRRPHPIQAFCSQVGARWLLLSYEIGLTMLKSDFLRFDWLIEHLYSTRIHSIECSGCLACSQKVSLLPLSSDLPRHLPSWFISLSLVERQVSIRTSCGTVDVAQKCCSQYRLVCVVCIVWLCQLPSAVEVDEGGDRQWW
jgi:hypothetical protein